MTTTSGIWLTNIVLVVFTISPGRQDEICQLETFKADCGEDHVIVMESAHYGRMMLGRCLTRNYYVGCQADVLPHMDARCSGRPTCHLRIPDPVLFDAQPCPKDLVAYLEATYRCQAVTPGNSELCPIHGHVKVSSRTAVIASSTTWNTGVGAPECPWRLTARPGERLRLFLTDFSVEEPGSTLPTMENCRTYGYIKETVGNIKANTEHLSSTICGTEERESHVYSSETNQVDLIFIDGALQRPFFLIRYEVFGCPLPRLGHDAWLETRGDTIMVHCNNSDAVYHLYCDGTQWVGDEKNCTTELILELHTTSSSPSMQFGLFIAISIGVALGVLLGIGLLVLSYSFYNKHRKNRLQRQLQREENILLKEQVSHQPCRRDMFEDMHHVHYIPKMHCTHAHGSLLSMTEVKPPGYAQDATLKRDFATYGERRSSGVHPGDEMRTFRAPSIYDTTKNLQALDVLPPCVNTRKSPNIYRCVHEADDLIEVPEEEMVSLATENNNTGTGER